MNSSTRLLGALALFAIAATPSCLAQETAKSKPTEPKFAIEAGELKINELIDRSAAYLHWNILFNEQELAQAATPFKLQQRTETDRAGCEELFTSLLYQRGFVVLPLDSDKQLFEIISCAGPRAREISNRAPYLAPEKVLARPNLRMPVLTVVQLQHVNATIATNALRPFFASSGPMNGSSLTLGNVGNNASLLLTGMQDQVAYALRMLQTVDVASPQEPAPGLAERIEQLEARIAKLEKMLEKR